ncbi:MAG: serine hydrolase [Tannerella sp.]|jgi:beta-glucosidase-like glycosyl hydrolase/CubicO group peptidase (beta-lactamase class C family)|nr:serine hydrolase [Tannerella sp.]
MKHILIFLSILFSLVTVKAQIMPELFASVDEKAMNHWVDSVFDSMSEDERIGQLFMIIAEPVAGTRNITKLINLVNNQKIGGILFQRGEPEAQITVTNRLQKEARIPLLIALDGEWGLSMRLSNTTRFPKNMMLGAVSDSDILEQYGEEVGRQCREMGIHVNFAPDADVNSNPDNPVIGIRSFGEDPEDVAHKVIAYARGLEKAGIISVAKHFPGHGDTNKDSHHLLPIINHNRERLYNVELHPFGRYINSGLSGIMVAHLDIPALGTNGRPSSFSREIVTELLRDKMGFRGLCFTDGLAMKGAVAGKNESIAVEALKAGNDVLVGPAYPEKEFEAVRLAVKKKQLDMSELDRRCRRILCYKYIAGLNNVKTIPVKSLYERLHTPHSEWLNAKLNAEAVTIVKNDGDILPLKQLDKKRIAALSPGTATDNEFHRQLKRYDDIDCYNLPNNADYNDRKNIVDKLNDYDVIICSIHPATQGERPELQDFTAGKEVVFVFFTPPYQCTKFKNSIENAPAVVIAYEPTLLAQNYAAQAIFGGISAKGSLSVGVPGLFPLGTGIITEKTRLGFHEPEEVGIHPHKLQMIDTIVQEGLDAEAYPGCQVIVAKDGMIIYNKAFGYYDYSRKQAVTEKTVYDLASVSKAAGTLLASMKSYDDENFQLSDKISDFVSELKYSDKKNILIRDLFYHQSGLPPTIPFYELAIDKNSFSGSLYSGKKDPAHPFLFDTRTYVDTSFRYNPNLISTRKQKGFQAEAAKNFYISDTFVRDSILSGIKNARMNASGKYTYSCINFILLKMMIEQQTGEPMDKFLHKHFFDRLGASSVTYNPLHIIDISRIAPTENDRFVRRQVLRGYVHDEAAAFQGGVSGNAGLFSSAADLAKIMQLYLNNGTYGGERYLSEKTCKLFTGSKSPVSRRGLGFDKPDAKNPSRSPCGLLTPQAVYGHTGYTGTCFWIDPVNNMFFIFLSNRTYPSRTNTKLFSLDIRTRIQDAIYKSLE